jgi:hypothetical protein
MPTKRKTYPAKDGWLNMRIRWTHASNRMSKEAVINFCASGSDIEVAEYVEYKTLTHIIYRLNHRPQ